MSGRQSGQTMRYLAIGGMIRRRMATMVLAASVAAGSHAPHQAAATQPAVSNLRLYVFDCGTLIYNNPETYNLTRQ